MNPLFRLAALLMLQAVFLAEAFTSFLESEPEEERAETYFGRKLEESVDNMERLVPSFDDAKLYASRPVFDNFQNSGPYGDYDYQDYFYGMGYDTLREPERPDKIRQTFYPEFKARSRDSLHVDHGFSNGFNNEVIYGADNDLYHGFNDGFDWY